MITEWLLNDYQMISKWLPNDHFNDYQMSTERLLKISKWLLNDYQMITEW